MRTNQAQSICFKIQCDQYLQTAAKDATGERAAGLQALASTLTGQGITVSNIVDYMSLIEQRSVQVRQSTRRPFGQHGLGILTLCPCVKFLVFLLHCSRLPYHIRWLPDFRLLVPPSTSTPPPFPLVSPQKNEGDIELHEEARRH